MIGGLILWTGYALSTCGIFTKRRLRKLSDRLARLSWLPSPA